VLAAGVATAALAATTAALAPAQAATASYSAAYTCTTTAASGSFPLQMDVTVRASRSGGTTTVKVPGGSPVLSDKDTYSNVRLTSTLDATVDGSPLQLTSDRTVTIRPNEPVALPDLVATTTRVTRSTLTFVPGKFVLVVKFSLITATQTCTLTGAAPTATVPVEDPSATPAPAPTEPTTAPTTAPTTGPAPAPTPTTTPTTAPTTAPTTVPAETGDLPFPRMSVKLTKKTQRVGRKPATVVVVLRPSTKGAVPAGTVKVTVGKRKVRTATVSTKVARKAGKKGVTLRIPLPKNLKPGRHAVKVKVAWKGAYFHGHTVKRGVRVKR